MRAPRFSQSEKLQQLLVDTFGVVPVFVFKPLISQIPEFDGQGKELTGVGMPNVEATKNLNTVYTIIFSLRVKKCPTNDGKLGYIFGHTGVGGYGLRVRGKGEKTPCMLEFVQIGSDNIFSTGYSPFEGASE